MYSVQCVQCSVQCGIGPSTCLMTHLWRSQLRGAGQWEHYADLAVPQCLVYSVYSVYSGLQCVVYSVQCLVCSIQCQLYSV